MSAAMLLFIGRTLTRADSHFSALQKRYDVLIASSATNARAILQKEAHNIELIVLDAVSLRTPGERMSRELKESYPKIPLIHLYPGKDSGDSIAEIVMTPPITPRKLLNNVERLLVRTEDSLLNCGPFTMNLDRRILIAFGHETELTPKLADLLELFLRHPNKVLDRKHLMETIWQTDYLGDTRTLDVHIRWVRQALEGGGKFPRRLKTVRGVGYQLEIPELNKK
jgi:DNA-binding response OmpR family regulator